MHQVIRHDLPNQMVALQSLLQFLSAEEANRLSDDGQEYVRRLQSATLRTSEMVRFLKQMEQMKAFAPRVEEIQLNTLSRELQGELQRLQPEKQFHFDWHWHNPTIVADSRTFLQALLRIFTALTNGAESRCEIRARSERRRSATELFFEIDEESSSAKNQSQHSLEQSLDLILAREWLALSDSVVEVLPPTGGRVVFRILVNNR